MRDNYQEGKTMRRIIIFLLTLIILSACSSTTETQIFTTEIRPSVTAPAPTKTPEPTKKPSFVEVFPSIIQRCKAENDIPVANMAEGEEKILAFENALGLTVKDAAGSFIVGDPSIERYKSQRPNAFSIMISRSENGNQTFKPSSCFHLTFPDGGEAYVIGIPVLLNPKDDKVVFLHFADDPNATKKLMENYDQQGLPYGWSKDEKLVNIHLTYNKLHSGNFSLLVFSYLLPDPPYEVAPYWNNMRYLRDILLEKDFYNLLAAGPSRDWKTYTSAKKEEVRENIQKLIIPTIGFSVVE
jgi:hypothetical protein